MDSESNWDICPVCLGFMARTALNLGRETMRAMHAAHKAGERSRGSKAVKKSERNTPIRKSIRIRQTLEAAEAMVASQKELDAVVESYGEAVERWSKKLGEKVTDE